MIKFSATGQDAVEFSTPCIVVGVFEGGRLSGTASAINKAAGGRLARLIKAGDVATAPGKTFLWTEVPGIAADRVLVVGCGSAADFTASRFVKAATQAAQYLSERRIKAAASALHELAFGGGDPRDRIRLAALASASAVYRYSATRSHNKPRNPLARITFFGTRLRTVLSEASAIARGVERARELGNLPPNICTPAYLAQECRLMAERLSDVTCRVLGRKQMEKLGMGALLGVARASANPPKLIVLNYRGARAKDQPYAFVGKGITFDTGGISLKPGKGMDEMKYDMCGAAGVIGAFEACALLKLKINLVAVVPAVENMPGGNAYRPGDVLTSASGQTIEVLNTDAEGRLILCDALTYVEQFKPQGVIDAATLTGACVVALGKHATGLMTNDDKLAQQLLKAGDTTHDRAWRLPLWDDYQSQLDTPYADMANIGGPAAGAVTAGCFLARFTKKYRWAHLDVAGSAWDGGTKNGATGRPVPLLTQFLIDRAG